MHRQPIDLHTFPAADSRLREDAAAALAALEAAGLPVDELREALERRLQTWYPNLRVTSRGELGSLRAEPGLVWYVIRDRRIRPPSMRRERLYETLGRSRSTLGDVEQGAERARRLVSDAAEAVARSRGWRGGRAVDCRHDAGEGGRAGRGEADHSGG